MNLIVKNAPYQSDEEARAAAEEAGLVEGTHEFWRFTDQFWKCPPIGYQMGSGNLDTTDSKVLISRSKWKKHTTY